MADRSPSGGDGVADTPGDEVESEGGDAAPESGDAVPEGGDAVPEGGDAAPEEVPDDSAGPVDAAELLGSTLEPGSPSLENTVFVVLGMVAALVVWLLLLP